TRGVGVSYALKNSRGTTLAGMAPTVAVLGGDGIISPAESTADDLTLLGGNSIAALGNANNRVNQPTLQLAISLVLGRHTLISFIEALRTVNLTDVQAAPVVTTLDHRTARVQVGQETPVRVVDLGAQTAGP